MVWQLFPVKYIKKSVDGDTAKKLEWVQDEEGCPHVEVLDALAGPTGSAYQCVGEHGGIAWQVLKHSYWYWHPQADFKPLTCNLTALRINPKTGKVRTVKPPISGKNCNLCVQKIKERS